MNGVYYNEIDPYAAGWLRNLIAAGHIASGDVDERSIADVRPDELRGYTQCHFFAGIGVWSYALRRAGWADDRPVWTGSCPCQPFSAAGRGEGFADERHLWPAFHHLIAQRRPPVVFGEQVASKAVDAWIDLVQDDMEGLGYAFGAVPFPSAGVGAPHIRDRAYFVAHAADARRRDAENARAARRSARSSDREARPAQRVLEPERDCAVGRLADAGSCGLRRGREPGQDIGAAGSLPREVWEQRLRSDLRPDGADGFVAVASGSRSQRRAGGGERPDAQLAPAERAGAAGVLAEPAGERRERGQNAEEGYEHHGAHAGRPEGVGGPFGGDEDRIGEIGHNSMPGPTNGFWRDPDWLHCRDGRWRPVEPGTFPLAHGAPARVGRLRAYGNAINAEAAAAFISAARDVLDERRLWLTELSTMSVAEVDVFA